MTSVTGALSALWSTAVFLYNVIDKVQSNNAECRETIVLLCGFLTDLEELRSRNVSPSLYRHVAKLVKTFEDIKVDVALLEAKSILSRAIFHEQIASKLAKARSNLNEATMQLSLQLQLERYRSTTAHLAFPTATPYGSSSPRPRYEDVLSDGIRSHDPHQMAVDSASSDDFQPEYSCNRIVGTENHARSIRSCFKRPLRANNLPEPKVTSKGTGTGHGRARPRRPRSRPCSAIVTATSSSRGIGSNGTPNCGAPRGVDREAARRRSKVCE
ncbi:hypothetical protein PsYK624_084540 [Phanerochaete sordida]|uniref:Fungal N-terminal domain-containing protein n=1 Tax=Phanerochaete sordida TaxID=48140 RepID=A0A9P3GCR5_9APHY|nr:hypothetical protein PsYK624_084540 [Phanerochaete sordida]